MRRQARISGGGALVVRSASALQVWLWLLIFIFQNEFRISWSIQPGYLDFDNLPETNFTCAGKVIGGYYADLETSCQMFHVCTVGQNDEPMDIKFLCLNGTVFDQETRVCERVDEVDCTKSEKFYSLNLELYGSTAPPIIDPGQKSQEQPTEQSQQQTKTNQEADPTIDNYTSQDKTGHSTDSTDTTEDPIQEIKRDEPKTSPPTKATHPPLQMPDNEELTEEYQEDDEDPEYEDYSPHEPITTTQATTTSTSTTTSTTSTTTTTPRPPTTVQPSTTSRHSSAVPHLLSSPSPMLPTISQSLSQFVPIAPSAPSAPSGPSGPTAPAAPSVSLSPSLSTLDPSLLSPQEFIYRHRGPGSEAISFQRNGYRPADGVYITHAPPQQFDHFQYESSRTAPRPAALRPAPFVQRPQPAPFRATTLDPRDQLLRPGPVSQPSERHETAVKQNRPQSYSQALPAQRPLPFNPYYYDRKRSDDTIPETGSALSARSVAPPNVTQRPPIKLKSPPRVIVTASASVSDSNGKRLNYTVGNVVSAVKPIVPINYDDYKESDLIFDPFFLDVPKLQKRRKTRSNRIKNVFAIPSSATFYSKNIITTSPVTTQATRVPTSSSDAPLEPTTTQATLAWNPNDYVDDNYEPHAYMPPIPPLAVLVPDQQSNYEKQERSIKKDVTQKNKLRDRKSKVGYIELKSASAAQTTSSQGGIAAASPPPPPHTDAPACAPTRFIDCRTRA